MKKGRSLACVGTICRIHRSLRNDPFRIFARILGGKPKPIGIRCQSCGQALQRVYTQAQVTGRVFRCYACACTMLSQPGQMADPTSEEWSEVVSEAKRLAGGGVKVHASMVEETPDVEGDNQTTKGESK
jgi:hypothetical protein